MGNYTPKPIAVDAEYVDLIKQVNQSLLLITRAVNENKTLLDSLRKASSSSISIPNSINGTAKQVIVTPSGGNAVTLSTPQDIDVDSDVEFGKITASDIIKSTKSGSGLEYNFIAESVNPVIGFNETDASADNKRWFFQANGETFILNTRTDDGVSGNAVFTVSRTGTVVDDFNLNTNLIVTGNETIKTGKILSLDNVSDNSSFELKNIGGSGSSVLQAGASYSIEKNTGKTSIGASFNPASGVLLHLRDTSTPGDGLSSGSIMFGYGIGPEIQSIQEGADPDKAGLAFRVKNDTIGSNPNVLAMTILANGNVGIGTSAPASRFAVSDVTSNIAEIRVERSTGLSSTYASIGTVGGTSLFKGTGDTRIEAGGASKISFSTNSLERVSITSSGDVTVVGGDLTVSSGDITASGNVRSDTVFNLNGTNGIGGIGGTAYTFGGKGGVDTSSFTLRGGIVTNQQTLSNDIIEIFQTLKSGTQATTTTPTVLSGWATATSKNGGTSPCTLNSGTGEITLDKTGWYKISFWANGVGTGTNRTQLVVDMQEDTGGGYANSPGASDSQYNKRNSTQDTGSIQFHNFSKSYTATDKIKFMISHVGEINNINSDGSRISIEFLGV